MSRAEESESRGPRIPPPCINVSCVCVCVCVREVLINQAQKKIQLDNTGRKDNQPINE